MDTIKALFSVLVFSLIAVSLVVSLLCLRPDTTERDLYGGGSATALSSKEVSV